MSRRTFEAGPSSPESLTSRSEASSDARSRRSKSSSGGSSTRGPFGISVARYRVGAPPLVPLPLAFHEVDRSAKEWADQMGLMTVAKEVLLNLQVAEEKDFKNGDATVEFCCRCISGRPETGQSTIFIVLKEWEHDSEEKWQTVARGLKQWIDNQLDLINEELINITVEIMARDRVVEKIMSPVEDQPKLKNDWPLIRTRVREILDSFDSTKSLTSIISLFKFGPLGESYEGYIYPEGDHPITIYIGIDYQSQETSWSPVLYAIESYLEKLPHELVVHMENNIVVGLTFPLLTPPSSQSTLLNLRYKERYSQRANMGADICPSHYLTRSDGQMRCAGIGTLGCYVETKTKGSSTWETMGLTNYHVVRPAFEGFRLEPLCKENYGKMSVESKVAAPEENSALRKADKRGFGPNQAAKCPTIEHPSRARHNKIIDFMKRKMPSHPEFAMKLEFFDQDRHILGTLWGGSGYCRRTSSDSRLDWALIKVNPDRVGRNLVPPAEAWYDNDVQDEPDKDVCGNLLRPHQEEASLRNLKSGDRVYKVGATSHETLGKYNEFKSDIMIGEEKYMNSRSSVEHTIIGAKHDVLFATNGDSGSVVFDPKGRIVGLLFRGSQPQQSRQAHTLVTPIEDVFADIKEFAMLEDIRLAQ